VWGTGGSAQAHVYSRFLKKLIRCANEVEKIFARLVDEVSTLLPDFGQVLALDSKAITSLARGKKQDEKPLKPACTRDTDAD
jgi:hypothetical protein